MAGDVPSEYPYPTRRQWRERHAGEEPSRDNPRETRRPSPERNRAGSQQRANPPHSEDLVHRHDGARGEGGLPAGDAVALDSVAASSPELLVSQKLPTRMERRRAAQRAHSHEARTAHAENTGIPASPVTASSQGENAGINAHSGTASSHAAMPEGTFHASSVDASSRGETTEGSVRAEDASIVGTAAVDASATRLRAVGVRGKLIRSAVALTLVATTLLIPLTGKLGPQTSIGIAARTLGYVPGGVSWAYATQTPEVSSALNASVGAASRSRVRAPLTVTQCVPSISAADGSRAVTRADTIYWPMSEGTYEITSPFSLRISPVSGELLQHEGIDMAGRMGTPIYAIAPGEVIEVSENSRSGALIKLKHRSSTGEVFYSMYLHQYMKDILVTVGQTVQGGEHIGAVGSNGWSTGPHLHFEVHGADDKPVDPEAWMARAGAVHIGKEC